MSHIPHPDTSKRRRREPGMTTLGLGTVRVSEEVSRAFRAAADERGISYAEAIREALGQWVMRQAQSPQDEGPDHR